MKVLHLSTSDIDGGAARAAYRLHRELNELGMSSKMLVRDKQTSSYAVIRETSLITKLGPMTGRWPLRKYLERDRVMFSSQWFKDDLSAKVLEIDPDVVHLHWVCNGFLKIETLRKFDRPIVWTLHDMWPMTGGCHYTQACDRYQQQCGNCPVLHSDHFKDLSFEILRRKASAWDGLDLTIVAPSQWLADCAKASALFRHRRIEVIANGIDTSLFRPGFKQTARAILNLPPDKKLLLFVAGSTTGDPRKGFQYLVEALNWLQTDGGDFELAILGENAPDVPLPWLFKTHYLGRFSDEVALALVYSAADLFVAPSVQDNLPNTVVEALACGTPCVAFDIGGMPDMIDHLSNGYLAKPFDVKDLGKGIAWALAADESQTDLSGRARLKAAQSFSSQTQAARVLALYQSL
jgi:glycosyltransferase involved in cell wall biosynthesis